MIIVLTLPPHGLFGGRTHVQGFEGTSPRVCLVEIELTHPNGLAFRTARVIFHGKTRRASLAQATISFARYDEIGHFYTGHITETLLRPVVIIDDETRDALRYPR